MNCKFLLTASFLIFLTFDLSFSSARSLQRNKRFIDFIGGTVNKVIGGVGGVLGGGGGGYRQRPSGLFGGGGGSQSNAQASSYNHNVKGCLLFNLACVGVGSSGAQATADSASNGGGHGGSGSNGGAYAGNNGFDGGSYAGANGGSYGWRG